MIDWKGIQTGLRWLGLGLAMAAGSASATSFAPQTLQERTEDATAIVRGTVGASHSDWGVGRDGMRRIYTFTEFSTREVIKDSPGEADRIPSQGFLIRELGGVKDGVGMEVSGTARFNRGEDLVLMIGARNPDGSFDLRGMMMGKFGVERDPRGQEVLVGPGVESSPEENAPVWTLDRLRTLVREQQAANPVAKPALGPSPGASAPSTTAEAPALQPQAVGTESAPKGSQLEIEGSERQASSWGWGLVIVLGALGLWLALRSKR